LGDDLVIEIMKGEKMAFESFKMATVVIGVLPMLALYPFLQRFFIHGVYLGAVKG
jgi:putative aldouronate transport system permease protein